MRERNIYVLTWLERLQADESLQAFVSAEIKRAGIEVDTLRWQRDHDRNRIAALAAQLEAAHVVIKSLRRQLGRGRRLMEDSSA